MDVSEMEPVYIDLEIGLALAEDVEIKAIPTLLFHQGALEGAHGEEDRVGVNANGVRVFYSLRALGEGGCWLRIGG